MSKQRVVQFEYQQALVQESGSPRWSEELNISVRILSEALTSGWLREHFAGRGGANDFLVLLAIAMHARPLRGDDLTYLTALGVATSEDENRLYARVSDLALADELGLYRTTIASSAQRLAGKDFITVREIPEEIAFRDSHGRFGGSKVYLLAGDLNNRFLVKDVASDRGGLTDTVNPTGQTEASKPREGLTATVPATVRVQPTHHARSDYINRGEEEEEEAPLSPQEIIFGHFASCKKARAYKPSARDEKAVYELMAEGYSLPQILAGINRAFSQHSGKTPIRQFTFCVPVIRDTVPQPGDSDSPQYPPEAVPGQEEAVSSAGKTSSLQATVPVHLPEVILLTFTLATGTPPTEIEQRRLLWLAEECTPAALARQENVWDWLVEALKESAGRAENLLAYTIAVMRRRATSSPEQTAKEKPATPNSGLVRVAKRTRHTPDPALATLQAMQNLFPQEKSDGPA